MTVAVGVPYTPDTIEPETCRRHAARYPTWHASVSLGSLTMVLQWMLFVALVCLAVRGFVALIADLHMIPPHHGPGPNHPAYGPDRERLP